MENCLLFKMLPEEIKFSWSPKCVNPTICHSVPTNGCVDVADNVETRIERLALNPMKRRRTSKELRYLVGVESITSVIRSDRLLRWYGHVMSTG